MDRCLRVNLIRRKGIPKLNLIKLASSGPLATDMMDLIFKISITNHISSPMRVSCQLATSQLIRVTRCCQCPMLTISSSAPSRKTSGVIMTHTLTMTTNPWTFLIGLTKCQRPISLSTTKTILHTKAGNFSSMLTSRMQFQGVTSSPKIQASSLYQMSVSPTKLSC